MNEIDDTREGVKTLLEKSLVFPEYIRVFLLQRLFVLSNEQIQPLATILQEEEARLKEIE